MKIAIKTAAGLPFGVSTTSFGVFEIMIRARSGDLSANEPEQYFISACPLGDVDTQIPRIRADAQLSEPFETLRSAIEGWKFGFRMGPGSKHADAVIAAMVASGNAAQSDEVSPVSSNMDVNQKVIA